MSEKLYRVTNCRYCERYSRACGRVHTADTFSDWGRTWEGNAPTDRERAEMYRAEMSKLRSELNHAIMQRNILAHELLNLPAQDGWKIETVIVLNDLVEKDALK